MYYMYCVQMIAVRVLCDALGNKLYLILFDLYKVKYMYMNTQQSTICKETRKIKNEIK